MAIVEALTVGEDWSVPSTSLWHTAAFVQAADSLFVEVNFNHPVELENVHDVYRREDPPFRGPIPVADQAARIGMSRISFDPTILEGWW